MIVPKQLEVLPMDPMDPVVVGLVTEEIGRGTGRRRRVPTLEIASLDAESSHDGADAVLERLEPSDEIDDAAAVLVADPSGLRPSRSGLRESTVTEELGKARGAQKRLGRGPGPERGVRPRAAGRSLDPSVVRSKAEIGMPDEREREVPAPEVSPHHPADVSRPHVLVQAESIAVCQTEALAELGPAEHEIVPAKVGVDEGRHAGPRRLGNVHEDRPMGVRDDHRGVEGPTGRNSGKSRPPIDPQCVRIRSSR